MQGKCSLSMVHTSHFMFERFIREDNNHNEISKDEKWEKNTPLRVVQLFFIHVRDLVIYISLAMLLFSLLLSSGGDINNLAWISGGYHLYMSHDALINWNNGGHGLVCVVSHTSWHSPTIVGVMTFMSNFVTILSRDLVLPLMCHSVMWPK